MRTTLTLVSSILASSVAIANAASFRCAESTPQVPVNPGCFRSFEPPSDGTCTCNTAQFFLQVLVPGLDVPHRVSGLGFWSNDGDTVFPAAGVLVGSFKSNGTLQLPSPAQLAALQASQITSPGDTMQAWIDLAAENLLVPAGSETVLFAVVQFPAMGRLTEVGLGPGILADAELPDQDCDFFSLDGGVTWQAPLYLPVDPTSEPLDWGFVVDLQPVSDVGALSWSQLKEIYRSP